MANFRKGAAAITQATESKGNGKFTPTFRWAEGEKKYILFLQSIEEIPTVLMHNFVITGINDATNKPIYSTFISRRDPALDGQDGYDELMDRFNEKPKERCIALAVELTPLTENKNGRNRIVGWQIEERQFETKENGTQSVPNVALIIESPFTFYGDLTVLADDSPLETTVFAVTRRGKGKDTSYVFAPAGDAPDLGDSLDPFFAEFDFDAYLDDLASEERMRELIAPLPDNWTVNPYSKKGGGNAAPAKSQPSRSTRFQDSTPQDSDAPAEAEAVEEEQPEGSTTSSRFNNLRKDFSK